MKGMFSDDFTKIKELYENFCKTDIGNYIDNWVKGVILITVVLFVLYVITCFITWSIPLPPPNCKCLKESGIFIRVIVLVYSFVILMVTFGSDDDYGY